MSRVIPHASSNSYNYTPKRVYHHTPIFAIQGWFFEKESEFLFNFTVITYQVESSTVYGNHLPCFEIPRSKQLIWLISYFIGFFISMCRSRGGGEGSGKVSLNN